MIATQLWRFVAPGLYRSEQGAFLPFLISSPVMFLLGASFAFYVVTPLAYDFFLGFQQFGAGGEAVVEDGPNAAPLSVVFQGSAQEYLNLTIRFIIAFGMCFQLPVLLTLMGKAGLVSEAGLKAGRKWAVVGILTLAALVTPPDVITQVILFAVVYGLYEVSIWLVARVERARNERLRREGLLDDDDEDDDDTSEGEMTDDALTRIAEALERCRRRQAPPRAGRGRGVRLAHRPRPLAPVCAGEPRRAGPAGGDCRARDTLLANTRQFARGLPANNALLWGARGMGKSSLVKAVHGAVLAQMPDAG